MLAFVLFVCFVFFGYRKKNPVESCEIGFRQLYGFGVVQWVNSAAFTMACLMTAMV